MQKLVLFQIGNKQFGMDMSLVTDIQQGRPVLAAQPESDDPDVLIIDGKTIPFYNLPDLFGLNSDTKESTGQKIAMVKDQTQTFAFLVNRVEAMIDADENQIDRLPPVFKGPASDCFPRVLRMEDSLILLMDPKGIGRIKTFATALESGKQHSSSKQSPEPAVSMPEVLSHKQEEPLITANHLHAAPLPCGDPEPKEGKIT